MTGDLSSNIESLSGSFTEIEDALAADLEALLNHPCEVTIEEIDTETEEVTLRVEPDLAALRKRLEEENDYESIDLGIDGEFKVQIWPTDKE